LDREVKPNHRVRQFARWTDEELNCERLKRTYSGRGSRPHRPDLLLKLVIYEHSKGRPQPVQWFEDLQENKPVQWLTFGIKPSLTTLYEFRDRVQPLLGELNQQVIRTALAEGHTDGSRGALDGTSAAANASRHRLFKLETVEKHLQQLEAQIAEAEAAEAAVPVIARRVPEPAQATGATLSCAGEVPCVEPVPPSFLGRTLRGQKRQRTHYRRARAILRERNQANRRRRKDKQKKGAQIRLALGDPWAPYGLDKEKVYRPLYNIQVMSDVKTDLVFAYAAIPTTSDSGQLLPLIDRTNQVTGGTLEEVLVDSGYPSGADLAQCVERNVTVFAPWNENAFTEAKRGQAQGAAQIPKDRFTFDAALPGYRCPEGKVLRYRKRTTRQKSNGDYVPLEIYQADPSECASCPLKAGCVRGGSGARTVRRQEHEELIEALKDRMKSAEGKQKYRDRGCTVERRFADTKTHRGLRRISGRTPERADAQVGLTVLAHNLRILAELRKRRKQQEQNMGKTAS
jgi:transposase